MIQIVRVENPFEPFIHDVEEAVCLGVTLDQYFENLEGRDVFLNGKYVGTPASVTPVDGDQIIIVPHIGGGSMKKMLGFVAMIALSALTGGIIAGGASIFGMGIAGAGTFGAYLYAGAVMYLGGRLINALFPQQINNSANFDHEQSRTYGWDLPTIATTEGGVIGETYGVCIPQAQLLTEHVETMGDGKQYLNLLFCGGYGPVDKIENIRIDNTPIENYSNVQIETRLGTNEQTPISFFKNTPVDQSVNLMLDVNMPIIRTTDSVKASALEVTLEWNNGLYHLHDDGSYGSTSVEIQIDYRRTGTQEWLDGGKYTVESDSSESIRKAIRFAEDLEPGQYDVKVEMVKKPSGSRYMTATNWAILTSYNDGTYCRPNKVLVAMRILATNQLSGGIPNVNWRQTRSIVYVHNPHTKTYEAKAASNPIWAAYDILHGCRKLRNVVTGAQEYIVFGCAHESLDAYYAEWKSAADYADEKILNNEGGMERRFQFDAFFDTSQKRFDAAAKAAAVGHANIIVHGRNYGIVVDRPQGMTQIFAEGRTTLSSIQGSFMSKEERAHSVEITYNDKNNDFKNTQFTLRSPAWVKDDAQENTAQLTLFGVSRRTQAYREGIYSLATSERQLQFVELGTDINGLVCEYGDVVGYAHTVSRIGIASGRIVGATATTLTLDKAVTMKPEAHYEIYVTLQDDTIIRKEVVPQAGETAALTVTEPFERVPAKYDCFAFGRQHKAVKPFRVVGAERDGDLLVKLKLAEYDEAIYAAELDYDKYPDIDYTDIEDFTPQKWDAQVRNAVSNNHINITQNIYRGYDMSWRQGNQNGEIVFSTVSELRKNGAYGLRFGMEVRVLGYYKRHDGGGARYLCKYLYDPERYPWAIRLGETNDYEYKIVLREDGSPKLDENGEYELEKDAEGKFIPLRTETGEPKHKTMYAVICETTVNYAMFGAKLDGETNDYDAIYMAHRYQHDTYTIEPLSKRRCYLIKVANHRGIIRKDNDKPIVCAGDVDLSGSELLIQDCNATWYGFYLWGDNEEDYYTYEPTEEALATYKKDNFVINPQGYNSTLESNSVLVLRENPYAVRDDAGYMYSEPRYELLLHTTDGVLTSPFMQDWDKAGGLEIHTPVSDYVTHEISTRTIMSHVSTSYNMLPAAHYTFKGCDVRLETTANKYCSVLWCKCHNAHISGFNFQPNAKELHNTRFKNTMIYLWGCYNVEVSGITGFNAAGKQADGKPGTSGYVLRATNCLQVRLHDISVQGYWGATAMNCVKDVHITRVNINRLDIHNYFYNLWIDECNLFNHAVQIGEGRGICSITNSNFYINQLEGDSYPNAHILEFNLTYGRIFEGRVLIQNCNAFLKAPAGNEFDVCRIEFSPEAISLFDSYKLPEVTIRDCTFHSYNEGTYLCYFNVAGTRRGRTSTTPPSNIAGYCRDTGNDDTGRLMWKYIGRGVDWVDDGNYEKLQVKKGQIVRSCERFVNGDGKTSFYDVRHFIVEQDGVLPTATKENRPTDYSGSAFSCGTAKIRYVADAKWTANRMYAVGDYCFTGTSNWLPVFCWQCTTAGRSNGYRPAHLQGEEIDGVNVYPKEQDSCWWQHVAARSAFIQKEFAPNMEVTEGEFIYSDHKIYQVVQSGRLTQRPPQNTAWSGSFEHGSARLAFRGKDWQPQTWFAKGSYCISVGADGEDHIYQLTRHDGVTSGSIPVAGNARCVDGDIIWEYVGEAEGGSAAAPEDDPALKTGGAYPAPVPVGARTVDGTLPVRYIGAVSPGWRKAGESYEEGTFISDNTFIVQCIKSGKTDAKNKWGPLASTSGWRSDGTYVDNECTWKKVTPSKSNGHWRASYTHYKVGDVYYADKTEDGKYRLYQVVSLQENPGGDGFWQASAAYNAGDVVKANGHTYRCVFDGRLTLPAQTVIENIVTNMKTGGDIFSFYKGTDVPTKLGSSGKWIIKVGNLDHYRFKNAPYFGHEGNPVPEIVDANDYAKKQDIPTKLSQLENDAGFVTMTQLPTKLSQLENDVGYAMSGQIPTKVSQLENDAGYVKKSELPTAGG